MLISASREAASILLTSESPLIDASLQAFHDECIRLMLSPRYANLRRALAVFRDLDSGERLTANNLHLLIIEADSFHALHSTSRPQWHLDCGTPIRDASWVSFAASLLELASPADSEALFGIRANEDISLTEQAIALFQYRYTGEIDIPRAIRLAQSPSHVAWLKSAYGA